MRLRSVKHLLATSRAYRVATLTKAGGYDNGCAGPTLPQLRDNGRNAIGRCRYDGKIDRVSEIANISEHWAAKNRPAFLVYEIDLALEAARKQTSSHCPAD
jgi:hypothetical protein